MKHRFNQMVIVVAAVACIPYLLLVDSERANEWFNVWTKKLLGF